MTTTSDKHYPEMTKIIENIDFRAREEHGLLTGTGCQAPQGHFDPPFEEPDHKYWAEMTKRAMATIEEKRKGITYVDIQTARAEYEQARKAEADRIAAEQERLAVDLLNRGKARARRNSWGLGG